MGAKDSRPSVISYDDAVKRVPDSELKRIREAFKRCTGGNGTTLSFEAFVHEVLCDGVPRDIAEWLYQACGGSKRGITSRELLCGIVVLTRGTIDEKIKFLWTLYVNNQQDNGTYIYKWDFARTLHLENTSLPVTNTPKTAEILTSLFGSSEKVTYEQFRSWLLIHKDATVLSKWLLTDRSYNNCQDLETPTFYQSLAGVTHLEERDIIELEKCFWALRNSAPTNQLDEESLRPLLCPPLPAAAVTGTFLAFDENRDGHVDFKELCCGLSAACRGPRTERLKFIFKIFDLDRDGVLNKKELIDMVNILTQVANEASRNQNSRASTPDGSDSTEKQFDTEVVLLNLKDKLINMPTNKPMFQLGPTSIDSVETNDQDHIQIEKVEVTDNYCDIVRKDVVLSQEDFLIWSLESSESLVTPFLDMIFEVCHIVLGLRPQCKHQERDIVLGWLRRSWANGLSVGQFWYLVAAEWWAAWAAHCAAADGCCRTKLDDALGDESFTSSESMGSLLATDSASLASASSGIGSAGVNRAPGPVDNRRLLAPNSNANVPALTGEGGLLRRDVALVQRRDFELLPDALWRAVAAWHGATHPLPRQVIRPPNSDVELELYPLQLRIYRHVVTPPRTGAAPPERQLAYTAAFSRLATVKQVTEFLCGALNLTREDVRLWILLNNGPVLLEEENAPLEELQIQTDAALLLERRNHDLTWPEEIGALSAPGACGWVRRPTLAPRLAGATGLHNLGNTCYMNAALHAVWNTGPLNRYFNSGTHLYEINTANPLGTKGTLALRYGELCKEVWSGTSMSVAPLRVRWCVSRFARALSGGGQHDAQELLAWLLDALHEDLNRATRTTAQHKDLCDKRDEVAASEAWEQHQQRNRSIMTDLFLGQLKSKVQCTTCKHESTRFDVFNMLSLPLPYESYVTAEVKVILLDGSIPIKYGVRVNTEGTYYDLKKKLSELCGIDPDLMLVTEVSGAVISRVLEDGARVRPAPLTVYQLPGRHEEAAAPLPPSAPPPRPPVSAAPSLCMPALFCFKRSRSEIVMSQSPPGFYDGHRLENFNETENYRSHTLPKDLRKSEATSSPTLSVKSLNIKPSSPRLGRIKFGSSPSNMHQMNNERREVNVAQIRYLVAVHRKQSRLDSYFLQSGRSRPSMFGSPIIVEVRAGMTGRQLYAAVWAQLERLVTAKPSRPDHHNHATDCDDSLGYTFPFTLRVVDAGGRWCAACAWPSACPGCALHYTDHAVVVTRHDTTPQPQRRPSIITDSNSSLGDTESPIAKAKFSRQYSSRSSVDTNGCHSRPELKVLNLDDILSQWASRGGALPPAMLAIDWDPTALHLRYQTAREKLSVDDVSLSLVCPPAPRAVRLGACLAAFTRSERLEQPYSCGGCGGKQPATKKLQIWRLPPVLIIHLKRFQYVNNKWIKSQKIVKFPYKDFDPTEYLASVPQETIHRHNELKFNFRRRSSMFTDIESRISESEDSDDDSDNVKIVDINTRANGVINKDSKTKIERRRTSVDRAGRRERLESTSLVTTPVLDDNLLDYHKHRLLPQQDPFDLKYRLYAVVSHSGQMSGGHYVAYARNPSGTWLCYNDSSCRELTPLKGEGDEPPIDPASAYLLFYERQGLDCESYLPDVSGREPVVKDGEVLDPDDSDLKKMCVIS